MKIALASDLHLEFGDIELKNTEQADVLVLAGDILVAEDLRRTPVGNDKISPRQESADRFRAFLKRVSQEFENVVYVAGNHEFYHGKFYETVDVLFSECSGYSNLYYMEDTFIKVKDVLFVGSTLWTDCNKYDPVTMSSLQYGMNDYRLIKNDKAGFTRLRPEHTATRHACSKQFIQEAIKGHSKVVVVTHHAPSLQSVPTRFLREKEMNGGYVSDLSDLILDNPNIKLWVHGHTHDPQDYMVGSTRVACNPRGYIGYESGADHFKLKYFEI